VDSNHEVETVELDSDRYVQLLRGRQWPKYVIEWSVRRRVGDNDFPVVRGVVEALPPREGELTPVWDDLRQAALDEAHAAAGTSPTEQRRTGVLGRLFGRARE